MNRNSNSEKAYRSLKISQRGFTFFEAAVALLIVGLAFAAVWAAAASFRKQNKVTDSINLAWQISNNMRTRFTGQVPSSTLTENDLKTDAAGIFPSGSVVNGSPMNPWGGSIAITVPASGTTNNYDIAFNLPAGAAQDNISTCIEFLSRFMTSGSGTNQTADALRAEGGPVDIYFLNGGSPPGTSEKNKGPADMARDMANGCTGVTLRFQL